MVTVLPLSWQKKIVLQTSLPTKIKKGKWNVNPILTLFLQFTYHYYLNQCPNWIQAYHNTISAAGSWRSLLTLKRDIKIVSLYIQLQNLYTAHISVQPVPMKANCLDCNLPLSYDVKNYADIGGFYRPPWWITFSSIQTQPHPIILYSKRVIVLAAGLSPFHLVTLMVPWIPACLGAPADEQIKDIFTTKIKRWGTNFI